ncbi:MAG: alanine dehydrogenase [Planctomycetes bacterium]|nr:alanine dehydrogenase [Planctomycetota bacterium]
MKIGVIKEIKTHEYRVALTPDCVRSYVSRGHQVTVEQDAGVAAGFANEEYAAAGGTIEPNKRAIFDRCEMIVKVKEPLESEYGLFHKGQILFTYLHLAACGELTRALLAAGVKGVAYETIETDEGRLPCLRPMSEIAGRLAVQEAAKYLEKPFGGRGVLLGGVPGIRAAKVGIIGGGIVGMNACKIALGMGADVTILDVDSGRLAYLDDIFNMSVTTLYSTEGNIDAVLRESDVIIGAVLVPGAKAPMLVKRSQLPMMKRGAVMVDVAVDQGGCFETTHPTTHDKPVFIEEGVVHYCVANMPGAVALSSTRALTSATLPFGLKIAELGLEETCRQSRAIARGVNVYAGKCTHQAVARAFGLQYAGLAEIMEATGAA